MINCTQGLLSEEKFKNLARNFMLNRITWDKQPLPIAAEEVLNHYAVKSTSLAEARQVLNELLIELDRDIPKKTP